jgi:hypothetical protein
VLARSYSNSLTRATGRRERSVVASGVPPGWRLHSDIGIYLLAIIAAHTVSHCSAIREIHDAHRWTRNPDLPLLASSPAT